MLGIWGTPFSVIFIQFYIIASLFHKINPFFKKICGNFIFAEKACAPAFFWFSTGSNARCKNLVKSLILHKEMCCGKNYEMRKSRVFVFQCRNFLCKPLMHTCFYPGCGKPLWKNLWRMWKSASFQQVFRTFGTTPPDVENSAYSVA